MGEGPSRLAIEEQGAHHHLERNHQGLSNRLIGRPSESP